jgi:Pyruvate phosphate dikinase, AMP/ATP-binding domain
MLEHRLSEIIGSPVRSEVPYDALMPRRVSNLLLVSSLYDHYTIIEDGRLSEMLFTEYLDLDLRFTPSIERVSTAEEALEKLKSESFDLVISMTRVGEMNIGEFSEAVHAINPVIPVVLLACSARELAILPHLGNLKGIDSIFIWLGDVRLFLAIIKSIEDRLNALHDARVAGVRSIILIEDSIQFYSSYLPMLYGEILKQTHALTAVSVNRAQKIMRMRARPKVLLARTYEESLRIYEQHRNNLLGVIVDAAFPKGGIVRSTAGFEIARLLRERAPDLPILMQSDAQNATRAASLGLKFIDKQSPTLFADLKNFMQQHLGFGEFVFLQSDGTVLSRVPDLRTLEWAIQAVPEEYLIPNISRNDFYTWLMARTEFELSESIRNLVQKAAESQEDFRQRLLMTLRRFRQRSVTGVVTEYSGRTFEGGSGFVRIGKGSLGGKGRGLAFINSLINMYQLERRFSGVRIFVPPTAVLATSVFDQFMESSGLLSFALKETDDRKIAEAFLKVEFPSDVIENLWNFLQWVRYPLAIRSSSLLEDASYQPFAGIYKTYMIPNTHDNPEVRFEELCNAIKLVYASTYLADPKAYMESLPSRLEEEKMAVIIQQVVGKRYDSFLYPNFAGVGRSINFYPMPGIRPEDGVVSVTLGMGKAVVDGGRCVRFCPAYPTKPIQSFTPNEYLENSPKDFMALDLSHSGLPGSQAEMPSIELTTLEIAVAEKDGTLSPIGSVYSSDNDAVYDGTSRAGIRLVTMAGVLKGKIFPLADIMAFLLKVGTAASSCPVEIEFAVNLSDDPGKPHEFAFLQMRPLVLGSELQEIEIENIELGEAICVSNKALGNGFIRNVCDLVYVRKERFDRARTIDIAEELGNINAMLKQQKRPYILIGPGRWGSADPWLGIPVKWAQISAVRCIVETGFEDMHVDFSQGAHFFQNIMSFGIGYLTIDLYTKTNDYLDTSWLNLQPAETETEYLRHIKFKDQLHIALNGRKNLGVVMKPSQH